MKGRVCIVTGGNAGLGKAIATGLARLGATVVVAARDPARGAAAVSDIRAATGNSAVELLPLDLASQASVRAGAAEFERRYPRLDVLVNNASVMKRERTLTEDGMETMLATNHLGPFLLTNLLLDRLKASAPARILTLTAPSTVKLDFDDLQGARKFNALNTFGATKMANLLFTYELARRLAGSGVTANAVHPGLARTGLLREAPFLMRWLIPLVSAAPEKAAAGPVYLASAPELASVTGKFFKGQQAIESNTYSHDQDVQRRLWEVSARLVGLGGAP